MMKEIRLVMGSLEMETTITDLRRFVNAQFRDGNQIAIVPSPTDDRKFYLARVSVSNIDKPLTKTQCIGTIEIREMV